MLPHAAPPAMQLTDHVTDMSGLPVIVCVNCCVCVAVREIVAGATATVSGFKVIVAVPFFVLSAEEVAVTVTAVVAGTTEGAVYRPAALMLPQAAPPAVQSADQLTPVFELPETVAVNCCVPVAVAVEVAGATATETGVSRIVVLPVFVASDARVAVTVTVAELATVAGAVYSPLVLIDPHAAPPAVQLTLHNTDVLVEFVTVAVNCCVPPPLTAGLVGVIVTVGVWEALSAPPPPQAVIASNKPRKMMSKEVLLVRAMCPVPFVQSLTATKADATIRG